MLAAHRNRSIVRSIESGLTFEEAGRRFNLTRARIGQIFHALGGRRPPRPDPPCWTCGLPVVGMDLDEHEATPGHASGVALLGATRFWALVRPEAGCWEARSRRSRRAWQVAHGPIPEGMWVLHRCDNPVCVRPDHLYLGTASDNAVDRERAKGRHLTPPIASPPVTSAPRSPLVPPSRRPGDALTG